LSAETSPQTPLAELTALPDPLAGFQGALLLRGRKGKGRTGEERGRREFVLWPRKKKLGSSK